VNEERRLEGVLVGLIHAEAQDEAEAAKVETKLVKNLKWGARKNETERIVLHSFSHLAETKAQPEFTRDLLDRAEARLQAAGYETWQTPFGWFLDLDLAAPGRSAARIFASF
jgi:predicted deacetylase